MSEELDGSAGHPPHDLSEDVRRSNRRTALLIVSLLIASTLLAVLVKL